MNDARQKITDEYGLKEAQLGMAKRKWDAKIRMVQAKKRAAGVSLGRDDTARLMMDEAADAVRIPLSITKPRPRRT